MISSNDKNELIKKTFASFILFYIYKSMFLIGLKDRIYNCIIFDEAHLAYNLKPLNILIKQARKYGIAFVVASQSAKDFHGSFFSNIASFLPLKSTAEDAKTIVKNTTGSFDHKKVIDDIVTLKKYHAVLIQHGIPNKIKLAKN